MLISNPTNIRYLTGFVGVSPEEREAYALVTGDKTQLFVTALYREEGKRFHAKEFSRDNPIEKQLAKLLPTGSTLEFEEADLTVAEYQKLKKALPRITLVASKNKIEKLRMIKREEEIALIRKAAKITDACFHHILSKLTPGVEEREIAWEIESFFRKSNAESAFSPIVAFSDHSSQPHYSARGPLAEPQGVPLRGQDIVLLDFGAKVNGYSSDLTRVVFVGKPKEEWKKAYQTVKEAQEAAIKLLRPGVSGAVVDQAARSVITESGFPDYPHGLGHGVGLAIHEAPRLNVKKPETLAAGMVVTVEPGIYKEGAYGIRIEDLILLKKNGIEILSKSPK